MVSTLKITTLICLGSLVVMMPACHAGDPSSILGRGANNIYFHSTYGLNKREIFSNFTGGDAIKKEI